MEGWQKQHITKNLPELISLTDFNCQIQSELLANDILSRADIDVLDAQKNQHGKFQACKLYYEKLMGRKNAYKVLTKALLQHNQTGAASVLVRVPTHVFSKPLTYLDISVTPNAFQNVNIEVNGRVLKLHAFIISKDYEKVHSVFRETISELEFYDTFVTKERTFVLANNTIPAKPPFYVSRSLSNRINLNESVFQLDCPDVFVFKNTIARHKLSQIVKPHFTSSSSSQQTQITARFIHLDDEEDWISLKRSAKVPIHLINFETGRNIFLLEDTSAVSAILGRVGSRKGQVYLSEEEFLKQRLSEDIPATSICICDTPGMGKTYLLANIARLMSENCTRRIIVFIPLSTFAADFPPRSPCGNLNHETALLTVLKYTSDQNLHLLLKLVNAKIIQLDIFFDGFDEVPEDQVGLIKEIFLSITTGYPEVRIYISSRPHMRQELEESLNVVAYDILPFNREDQVDFLVKFWSKDEPERDQALLQAYATTCLEAVIQSLATIDKEITGIPLLCHLIAEVYANKVAFSSTKRIKLDNTSTKISKMYQKFIKLRIKLFTKTQEEFDDMKWIHFWHALKLLFPTNDFHHDFRFKNVSHLMTSSTILRIGIIQKHTNSSLEFIHRTFAEYLVADYFVTKLQDEENNFDINPMFEFLLKCRKTSGDSVTENHYDYYFLHSVIASFFNSALSEVTVSEKLKIKAAKFVSTISPEEIISILCTCCQRNVHNIFSLLKVALMRSDIKPRIQEYFSTENILELLSVSIVESTSQMFHTCISFVTEVLNIDVTHIASLDERKPLKLAVECFHYEAVEYFMERVPLLWKGLNILEKCVECSYDADSDIGRKENILLLLLNRDPSLIEENPNILICEKLHPKLIKILVQSGATLTSVRGTEKSKNCAMLAAKYMSPTDYHEFIQYLFTQDKIEYLLRDNENWKDPLPKIIKWARLLPESLDMLLKVPGVHINMKNKNGNNLAFVAIKGNKLDTLRYLVRRGLDYNARGTHNRTLLHAAAYWGDVEMLRFLLTLNLDPNSRTDIQATPLHYAVNNMNGLLVVEFLVENGADVQATNSEGQTALHTFAIYSNARVSNVKIIKYLVKKGLSVNAQDNGGNTPLHFCRYDKKIKNCLVDRRADINARNNKGETPAQKYPGLWKSS